MMKLETLTDGGKRKNRKRVGRGPGSGHGKTSTRGHKGYGARSGAPRKAGFEGGQIPLARRLPKIGFNHWSRFPYAIVNLVRLEKAFENGAVVTAEELIKVGLIEPKKAGVKVLGKGEFTKKLTLKVNAISAGARQKVEAAGGTVELVSVDKK